MKLSPTLVFALTVCLATVPAVAQEDSSESEDFAAVTAVKSLEQAIAALKYAGDFSENDDFADQISAFAFQQSTQVKGFMITAVKGLDQKRPFGSVTRGDGSEVLLYPTSDFGQLIESLGELFGAAEETDGVHRFEQDGTELFAKSQDDWCFFATDKSHLETLPDAEAALNSAVGEHLLTIVLFPKNSSEDLLGALLGGAGGDGDDAMAALQSSIADGQQALMDTVREGAERVTIGMDVDREAQQWKCDIEFVPIEGSTLSQHIARMVPAETPFGGLVTDDAHTVMHINLLLDEQQIEQFTAQIKAYRAAAASIIEQSEKISSDSAREPLQAALGAMMDALEKTIAAGRLHMAARMTGEQLPLTLVMAVHLVDTAGLNETFEALAAAAADDPGFAGTKVDVVEHDRVRIHAFHVVHADDPLSKMMKGAFRETLVHIAVGEDAAWLAMGPDSLVALQQSLDAGTGTVNPLHISIRTAAWPGIFSRGIDQQSLQMGLAVMSMNLSQGDDRVTISGAEADGNLKIEITAGDGIFKMVGLVFPMFSQMLTSGGL